MALILLAVFIAPILMGAFVQQFGGDLLPEKDATHDLGSINSRWNSIYVSNRVYSSKWSYSYGNGPLLTFSQAIGRDQLNMKATTGGDTDFYLVLDPTGTGEAYIAANATGGGSGILNLINASLITSDADLAVADATLTSATLTNDGAPTSITDTGTKGQIAFDSKYIYRCTETNKWKRSALSTWTDSYLLMETGDKVLLENENFIVLE